MQQPDDPEKLEKLKAAAKKILNRTIIQINQYENNSLKVIWIGIK
jgi:hypothetical protein